MKNILTILTIICTLLILLFLYENTKDDKAKLVQNKKETITTSKFEEDYALKEVHAKLSLECIFCHENQGNDPQNFEDPDDETCLKCHKSREHLANRLKFMDTLRVNPHNSVHYGKNLYCNECHSEHEESENMCTRCHGSKVQPWMGNTP